MLQYNIISYKICIWEPAIELLKKKKKNRRNSQVLSRFAILYWVILSYKAYELISGHASQMSLSVTNFTHNYLNNSDMNHVNVIEEEIVLCSLTPNLVSDDFLSDFTTNFYVVICVYAGSLSSLTYHQYDFCHTKFHIVVGQWRHMPLTPPLRRQGQAELLWVQVQPGPQREIQDSQSCTKKPYLRDRCEAGFQVAFFLCCNGFL